MGKDNVQNDEVEIDIGHILSILWEKILVIIATGIIVGLAGFLVSKFLITPKYESETKLYVLNRANDSNYIVGCTAFNTAYKRLSDTCYKRTSYESGY